jgi:hypothetical protein
MSISREDPRFWDVRTLERRVRKGLIGRKDVEKHLKSLDDVAERGEMIRLEAGLEPGDDDDGVEAAD